MHKKKFLFQLNHPAHFHLFKQTIHILEGNGHDILISIKDKDILKELVQDYSFVQLSEGYRKKNVYSIINSVYQRDKKLLKIAKTFKPDLMIGTSPEIAHIAPFVRIPSLFFGEDDVTLSIPMYIGAMTCYPLFSSILAPIGVNNSIWNKKTVNYNGFQKLAYLHPNRFKPDRTKVDIPEGEKYFIIRFADLQAYHDINAKGISNSLAKEIIDKLEIKGNVLISSERELPEEFKDYEFKGNKQDIHHYIYYANLFIGDSQSMAVESAMLGTPNIRFNDFVGKISVLEEIENKYKLSIGINSNDPSKLLSVVDELINDEKSISRFKERRETLIKDKIDVTAFMVWFIENYPNSVSIMKKDVNYQDRFKTVN
ncbi:MAG: putative glycosyltransferase [Polaribacter sp.]|jgi:predicted glycosyltransferase